ncbi:MAG: Holliday junction resolvase RuvX [Candidatus Tectomicrobia bacterium]|uniref:Putative pre-16S rRNA nuclease n=1 Tax=Tectimicrobiota bacterium TaxID=2528274 RepID=A0A933LQ32_UNCTE|nr:Holliday junction resolvase RuvX [Candidatus Tectomicrobia bacterium]
MNRILALDVGEKRIGLAVSDPLGITAQGLPTLQRMGLEEDIQAIRRVIDQYEVGELVMGFPKNMNGTIGPSAQKVLALKEYLEKEISLPIGLWDERLTSVSAERALLEGDLSRRKRKKKIDQVAAQLILQTYLQFKKTSIL